MANRGLKLKKIALIVASLIWLAPLAGPALAQSASPSAQAVGITVSPVVDEFSLAPGHSVTRTFKVTNPVHNQLTLYPVTLNFFTDNDQGRPVFYSSQERSSRYSLSDWIGFKDKTLTLATGETKEFSATVTAPDTAEPGGHYGAVLFSTEPPKVDSSTNQVSVVGLIGSLLLATVPGTVKQELTVKNFTAPVVLLQPPANFTTLFANTGTVHARPTGELKITNWSGATVASFKMNEGNGNVLPDSQRRFTTSWKFGWLTIGKYTATLAVVYGTPEKQLFETRSFIVLPWWLLIGLGLLVLILVSWLIRRRRGARPASRPPTPPAKQPRYVMR